MKRIFLLALCCVLTLTISNSFGQVIKNSNQPVIIEYCTYGASGNNCIAYSAIANIVSSNLKQFITTPNSDWSKAYPSDILAIKNPTYGNVIVMFNSVHTTFQYFSNHDDYMNGKVLTELDYMDFYGWDNQPYKVTAVEFRR